MKRIYPVLWTLFVGSIGFVEAEAGLETGPKVAVHVSAATSKDTSICATWSPNAKAIPCSAYEPNGSLGLDLLVYVVIAQADTPAFAGGISGISLGIEYNGNSGQGVDIQSWYLCADGLEVPNSGPRGQWPASGGGNIITWLTCQEQRIADDGMHGVVGAFGIYAYSADRLKLTPNRNLEAGRILSLANCRGEEIAVPDTILALGCAGFGGAMGWNPCWEGFWGCTEYPVRPTTWGRIKSRY